MSEEKTPIDGTLPPAPIEQESEYSLVDDVGNQSETSYETDSSDLTPSAAAEHARSAQDETEMSEEDSRITPGQGTKNKREIDSSFEEQDIRRRRRDSSDPFLSNSAPPGSPWPGDELSTNLSFNNLGLPSLGPTPSLGTPIHPHHHPVDPPSPVADLSEYPIVSVCFSSPGETKLFTNPMKVNSLFKSWEYNKFIAPNAFKVVGAGKCCILEMYSCPAVRENILSRHSINLGVIKVNVKKLGNPGENVNVVRMGPIDEELTLEEIYRYIRLDNSSQIDSISWIKNSGYLKIKVIGEAPKRIFLDSISWRADVLPISILRCFQCLEYGHGYLTCEKPARCTNCSEAHPYRTTTQNENGEQIVKNCEADPHCFQCGQSHQPTSNICQKNIYTKNLHKEELLKKTPLAEINKKLRTLRTADWKQREGDNGTRIQEQPQQTTINQSISTSNKFAGLTETSIDSEDYAPIDPAVQSFMNQNFRQNSPFQTSTQQTKDQKQKAKQTTKSVRPNNTNPAWTGQRAEVQLNTKKMTNQKLPPPQPPSPPPTIQQEKPTTSQQQTSPTRNQHRAQQSSTENTEQQPITFLSLIWEALTMYLTGSSFKQILMELLPKIQQYIGNLIK